MSHQFIATVLAVAVSRCAPPRWRVRCTRGVVAAAVAVAVVHDPAADLAWTVAHVACLAAVMFDTAEPRWIRAIMAAAVVTQCTVDYREQGTWAWFSARHLAAGAVVGAVGNAPAARYARMATTGCLVGAASWFAFRHSLTLGGWSYAVTALPTLAWQAAEGRHQKNA
jgi:hypothetical protein